MTANDAVTAGAEATLIDLETRARTGAVETKGDGEEAGGLATAHPKPAKRKNARERANDKAAAARAGGSDRNDTREEAKDGTTPMTAKAKSAAAYQEERQAAKVAAKKEKTAAKSAAKKAKGKGGR